MRYLNRSAFRSSFRYGGSLIEVIIALGLLAIFASTLFVSIGSQLLSAAGTRQSVEALSLAREGLEAARSIRDIGWSSLATGTHGVAYTSEAWGFQSTSDTDSGYRRTVTVTDLSTTEKQVVSTVSWVNPSLRSRTITLSTNMSNWRSISTPVLLTGNWKNPQTLSSFDLGAGIQGSGVAVHNGTVFMTGTASSASKKDFFIINVQNIMSPSLASSLNTGPGLNAVAVSSTFAYLANTDVTKQLQIVNISSTSSPYVVQEFRLTGSIAPALSVSVTGTLALVGTSNDSGPELFLVDVTNPSTPVLKSTLEVGGDVNRVLVLGNYAYLATGSSTREFMVVNITNPLIPVVAAYVNISGTAPALGLYVNAQNGRAYVSRQISGGTSPEISIYDITTPASPTLLGSAEFSFDVSAVFAADSLLFMGTGDSSQDLKIYDDTNPQALSLYSYLNFPQVPNDFAFENNVVYMAVRSNDSLRIITSQ